MIQPINIQLIKAATSEIKEMETRLESYKGDKAPFQQRIDVFKQLLEYAKSLSVDSFISSAEKERIEIAAISNARSMDIRERSLQDRERFINEWGGEMTDEQLERLAEILRSDK